jgi:hypothetical protein
MIITNIIRHIENETITFCFLNNPQHTLMSPGKQIKSQAYVFPLTPVQRQMCSTTANSQIEKAWNNENKE